MYTTACRYQRSPGATGISLVRDNIELIDPKALAFRQINTHNGGRFRISHEVFADPDRPCVIARCRFAPLIGRRDDYHVFLLCAPHIKNQGNNNRGRCLNVQGQTILLAWREGIYAISVLKRG